MKFTFEELKDITNAKSFGDDIWEDKYEISTDTRTIKKGDVYLPLCGEAFDGQNFIANAIEKGAAGCFFSNAEKLPDSGFALFVEDTKEAYLKLANYYKNTINPVTIAVTGSSGKTTTKELLAAIFCTNRRTHKSKLNHNNEIGLCQTLLSMPEDTEFLIVEMGMRGLGEIELLSKYAQPDYAVITNIGTAHIGRLGSRENIAKAKCEIVKYLSRNGVLISPNEPLIDSVLSETGVKNIKVDTNSTEFTSVLMSKNVSEFEYKGDLYRINVGGEYNVCDALLAIETALLCGLSPQEIQNGLDTYRPIENRFEETEINGLKIINDSYNANPESMKAALKTFLELYEGKKVLVLADMKELGENEVRYHKEIGEFLNTFGGFELITIGELAKNISDVTIQPARHFCDKIEVANAVKDLEKGTIVFFKGSHSMKLEEIIEEIKK